MSGVVDVALELRVCAALDEAAEDTDAATAAVVEVLLVPFSVRQVPEDGSLTVVEAAELASEEIVGGAAV